MVWGGMLISVFLCLFSLFFGPEDGGSTFLRNIGKLLPDNKLSHPSRLYFSAKNEIGKYRSTILYICYAFTEMR
jgi:hypothetical protein